MIGPATAKWLRAEPGRRLVIEPAPLGRMESAARDRVLAVLQEYDGVANMFNLRGQLESATNWRAVLVHAGVDVIAGEEVRGIDVTATESRVLDALESLMRQIERAERELCGALDRTEPSGHDG